MRQKLDSMFLLIHAFATHNTGFSDRIRVWLKVTASEDQQHAWMVFFKSSFPRKRESIPANVIRIEGEGPAGMKSPGRYIRDDLKDGSWLPYSFVPASV